jgi:hypothetical protein
MVQERGGQAKPPLLSLLGRSILSDSANRTNELVSGGMLGSVGRRAEAYEW